MAIVNIFNYLQGCCITDHFEVEKMNLDAPTDVPIEITFKTQTDFELFGLYSFSDGTDVDKFYAALKIIERYGDDGLSINSNESRIFGGMLLIDVMGKYTDFQKPINLKREIEEVFKGCKRDGADVHYGLTSLPVPQSQED